ncbi:hypothetical protein OAM00_04280 [Verrucomicrobia bacterium]|nr:hypothetical protein [Verrucomicrobiota bacterium]MDB4705281.1 hypothetical protein [Verrucomicrobiota bacterium]MDC0299980.1 hypothetical protein [Verrucomicrobiota bacterium]
MGSIFAKLIVVTSLTLSIGGHWGLLQTIAWSNMLLDYSENLTWTSALSKTIDPDTSCRICEFVQEGRNQESNQDFSKTQFKIDLVCEQREVFLNCPNVADDKAITFIVHSQFHAPPIAPPPRVVQV